MGRLWRCWKKKWCYLRERADTLGRVSYVPDFDVSSGNSEDETRSVPENETTKSKENRQNLAFIKSTSVPVLFNLYNCFYISTWQRQRCWDDLPETWSPDPSPSSRLYMYGLQITAWEAHVREQTKTLFSKEAVHYFWHFWPLDPVKSRSSVASTQRTGLVWPSAT